MHQVIDTKSKSIILLIINDYPLPPHKKEILIIFYFFLYIDILNLMCGRATSVVTLYFDWMWRRSRHNNRTAMTMQEVYSKPDEIQAIFPHKLWLHKTFPANTTIQYNICPYSISCACLSFHAVPFTSSYPFTRLPVLHTTKAALTSWCSHDALHPQETTWVYSLWVLLYELRVSKVNSQLCLWGAGRRVCTVGRDWIPFGYRAA